MRAAKRTHAFTTPIASDVVVQTQASDGAEPSPALRCSSLPPVDWRKFVNRRAITLASATLQNFDGAFAAREYWKRAPGRRTLAHRFGSRLDVHQERYVRTFGPASSSPLTYHAIGRHDDATRR